MKICEEYASIAYHKLGLLPVGRIVVGTCRYIDLPEDALHAVCVRRLNNVWRTLHSEFPDGDDINVWQGDVRINYFLLYSEWLHILKNIKSYELEDSYTPEGKRDYIVRRYFIRALYKGGKYEPTLAGWKKYLREASPKFYEFLEEEVPVVLPQDKLLNAYIVAGSQSGKTELLKLFAFSFITDGQEAVVFLDPAGHVSDQIAGWEECGDRLIYVDHAFAEDMTPTINPFELSGVKADDTSYEAREVKTVIAQQLLSALQEVLGTGEGADLSKNMQTVLMQCLVVLLDYPGATLRELHRFMDDKRNGDLVEFGGSRAHYPDVQNFFTHSFNRKNLDITKSAIHTKLQDLFSTGHFADLTCGKSTIDLERALEERKVIIFNLAKGTLGERESSAFGRLIVALLQGIAMRRERQGNPVPIRVIIDEVHNFTTKSLQTIITEAAKFKLFLIMAQQQIGQSMTPDMRGAVLNTSAQIGGRNSPPHHAAVAGMLGVEPKDIAALPDKGEFIIHLTGARPFKFKLLPNLFGWDRSMSEEEWDKVADRQVKLYYRDTAPPEPGEEIGGSREQSLPHHTSASGEVARVQDAEDEEVI